jgi:chemotaxis family two-component system sensor kinase Cph1
VLMHSLLPGQTATVVVLAVDPVTGEIELANAGHPPPLVVRAGTCEPLTRSGRPLLGIAHGTARTDRLTLHDDDILVIYTDGLVERRDVEIDTSISRLAHAAATFDHSETLDPWIDGLVTTAPVALDDDLTIVAVRRTRTST